MMLGLWGETWILKMIFSTLPFSVDQLLYILNVLSEKQRYLSIRNPLHEKIVNSLHNINNARIFKAILNILNDSLNQLPSFLMHLKSLITQSLIIQNHYFFFHSYLDSLTWSTGYIFVALVETLQGLIILFLLDTFYSFLVQFMQRFFCY